MSTNPPRSTDVWASAIAYGPYVGRWSRLVAQEFLSWLDILPESQWLDVGCGTGVLTQAISEVASPGMVKGIDASHTFVTYAQVQLQDSRVSLVVGDAQALPFADATSDAVVAGLVLNFVSQPARAVAEMARVVADDGTVAAYVWDYAGGMQLMRYFWDAAVALDPTARDRDQAHRFPICQPEPLAELFRAAGLRRVEVRAIDVPTIFRDFDDYWSPFLGGQGPAPGYAMSLSEERRVALREQLRTLLPVAADGSIHLMARAWAVRGAR